MLKHFVTPHLDTLLFSKDSICFNLRLIDRRNDTTLIIYKKFLQKKSQKCLPKNYQKKIYFLCFYFLYVFYFCAIKPVIWQINYDFETLHPEANFDVESRWDLVRPVLTEFVLNKQIREDFITTLLENVSGNQQGNRNSNCTDSTGYLDLSSRGTQYYFGNFGKSSAYCRLFWLLIWINPKDTRNVTFFALIEQILYFT